MKHKHVIKDTCTFEHIIKDTSTFTVDIPSRSVLNEKTKRMKTADDNRRPRGDEPQVDNQNLSMPDD